VPSAPSSAHCLSVSGVALSIKPPNCRGSVGGQNARLAESAWMVHWARPARAGTLEVRPSDSRSAGALISVILTLALGQSISWLLRAATMSGNRQSYCYTRQSRFCSRPVQIKNRSNRESLRLNHWLGRFHWNGSLPSTARLFQSRLRDCGG